MKNGWTVMVLCLISHVSTLHGQDNNANIEQFVADVFEQYTSESGDEIDYETFFQELTYLAENPVTLNTATREKMDKLLFLTDVQIESILYYIYRFGPLQSVYELQLIDGLDMTDIRRMLPFVQIGKSEQLKSKLNRHDLLKYGRNEILFRLDFAAEQKRGYMVDSEGSTPYQGAPFYNSVKYKYHFKDRIYAGLTMEKDAGESVFGGTNPIYDFMSAHFQINNISVFKTIVVGDFRASFGQGLIFGTGFGSGKSSLVTNVNARAQGLKKYSSSDEYNFFRGAGASVNLKKWELSLFSSYKRIDGDTIGGIVNSIYKTGLHRTINEIAKEKTISQTMLGFNATYSLKYLQLGFCIANTSLSHTIEPTPSLYNSFYFKGNRQTLGGLHYRARWSSFFFSGETAVSQEGGFATVNSVTISPHSLVNMVLLHRYYNPLYDSFYASAFSENTRINNESGIYTGIEFRPYKKWKVSAYADNYYFPWARYNTSTPSSGRDYLIQIDYNHNRSLNMYLRAKFEEKQSDALFENQNVAQAIMGRDAMCRYQLNYMSGRFTLRTMAELQLSGGTENSYGFAALQDITYSFEKIPLKIDMRYIMFDAEAYENRFYTYEKDVLYAFSIPSFYGKGNRFYINMKYELSRNFSFWLRFAQTIYADRRETVGTGLESISGNKRSDIRVLLKWDF